MGITIIECIVYNVNDKLHNSSGNRYIRFIEGKNSMEESLDGMSRRRRTKRRTVVNINRRQMGKHHDEKNEIWDTER